jgi:two-component system sensor histidine kinase HydH
MIPRTWSIRLQTALVIALFLGSLATVLFNILQTLFLPEFEVRDRLSQASSRMAKAALPEFASWRVEQGRQFAALNDRLRAITKRVLADFPGMEGGFYLAEGFDRFAGYGFPTERRDRPPPQAGSLAPLLAPFLKWQRGDNPPPKENDLIWAQAENSLSLDPSKAYIFNVQWVGPSRVAILTKPVGSERPAPLATWTMFRLVSPETVEGQLHRYQVSTGLALGGIMLAGLLTLNLGWTLKRQRLEHERLRDELRRAEHLAALGKLLAGVAHEVRNPLAGIRSTVQLWERLPDTARTPDSIRAVTQAVDRLNEIVSRLLHFSRADTAERQLVQMNHLLADTMRLLEAQAAAQAVSLELELEADLPAVLGSASGLRQVFLNLATNALQAMPKGGRLHCASRLLGRGLETTPQQVCLETTPQQRLIEIRFADTGPGISAEDRQHLFEPFFTTRPDGTGLGLAICREIVLQHGGQIEIVPEGPGTTFRVILPTK